MKPIHLVAGKDDLKPGQQYIQVKNGFCYAGNSFSVVKIPANEIFGDTINPKEEFYISAHTFGVSKADKAVNVTRNENTFEFQTKEGLVTRLNTIPPKEINGLFLDVEMLLPSKEVFAEPISALYFDLKMLTTLYKATGIPADKGFLSFYRKPGLFAMLKSSETKSIGLFMPKINENASC